METSDELRRIETMAQGVKRPDPLLSRWEATLRSQGAEPAIFGTRGEVMRTFSAIEDEASHFASADLRDLAAGSVVAIQRSRPS